MSVPGEPGLGPSQPEWPQPGMPQPGWPQSGAPQTGAPQGGMPQANWGTQPPAPRRRTGLIVGIIVGVVVIMAVVAAGIAWAVIGGSDTTSTGHTDAQYASFARDFVVDISTSAPGDTSRFDAATAKTCQGSPARKTLEEARSAVQQSGGTDTHVVGTPIVGVVPTGRTADEVPLVAVGRVASSGAPAGQLFAYDLRVRSGDTLCVTQVSLQS